MGVKKRIGIDIQSMFGKKSGLGTYTEHLINGLNVLNDKFEFLSISSFKKGDLGTPNRIFYDQIEKSIKAYSLNLDLFHITAFSAPFLYNKKKIITCHDLIPLVLYPPKKALLNTLYWKDILYKSVKSCDFIISISDFTKKDIVSVLDIPEDKIKTIYLGVDDKFKPIEKFDKTKIYNVKRKYNLPDKYILYLGNIEPRKNVQRLIEVCNNLRIPLVIVGKIWTQIRNTENVIFTGYVDELEKCIIYSLATVFVMPSLYEGFCFPIIEAMKSGIPVVSSDRTCLPEIGGDACLYFNPEDILDITDKIKLALNNERIRNELIEKGYKNASRFTWDKTCKNTFNLYLDLLQ